MTTLTRVLTAPNSGGQRVVRAPITAAVAAGLAWLVTSTGAYAVTAFLVGLVASVAAHEAGHALAAKAVGVKTDQFFVGFGPRLWSKTVRGTEYGVRAILGGGFVSFEDKTFEREGDPNRRMIVALAGPAVNVVAGVALVYGGCLLFGYGWGGSVEATWQLISGIVGGTVAMIVKLPVVVWDTAHAAFTHTAVAGDSRVMSAVGLAQVTGEMSRTSTSAAGTVLALLGVVNISLGMLNLMPMPPLDGGCVVAAGAEAVTGRFGRRRTIPAWALRWAGYGVVALVVAANVAGLALDVTQPYTVR